MIEAHAVILNSRGLHARPATKLAKLASTFKSSIHLFKDKKKADARSVAALLMLVASKDSEIKIVADGKDEKQAAESVLNLIASGFSDDDVVTMPTEIRTKKNGRYQSRMRKISGIGITDKVIHGRAHIHAVGESDIPRYRLEKNKVTAEVNRFQEAVLQVCNDFNQLREQVFTLAEASKIIPFVDLYLMLLEDKAFITKTVMVIKRRQINAEWALKERVEKINDDFRSLPDDYLRERVGDINYVMNRLLVAMGPQVARRVKNLTVPDNSILVAKDLGPADILHLYRSNYKGFIIESGTVTSHAAILARSMNIPTLLGVRGILDCVRHNTPILLDAAIEVATIYPDAKNLATVKRKSTKKKIQCHRKKLTGIQSKDKQRVLLEVNVDLPEELDLALRYNIDGVGLFRTEFMFMHREDLPSEDEQFEIYRNIILKMKPLPVVIRTLDIGGDKILAGLSGPKPVASTALGQRAIRYCLEMPDLFLTQLRALIRASKSGPLKILLPMISHPYELSRTQLMLQTAQEQLRVSRGKDIPLPPLGVMIEVPAVIFVMETLAKYLQFFSVGTNDLIQYAMAIDRNDETLTSLYNPLHPGILNLLSQALENANRAQLPITLCGEMASEPTLTRLILALGLRRLSMHPNSLDAVSAIIQNSNCQELEKMKSKILAVSDPIKMKEMIDKL